MPSILKPPKVDATQYTSLRLSLTHLSQYNDDIDGDRNLLRLIYTNQIFTIDDYNNNRTDKIKTSSYDDQDTDVHNNNCATHSITTNKISYPCVEGSELTTDLNHKIFNIFDKTEESHPPSITIVNTTEELHPENFDASKETLKRFIHNNNITTRQVESKAHG